MPVGSQQVLFDVGESQQARKSSSTFANNVSLPVHRWFKYSAGFSALWVRDVLAGASLGDRVLDPFAGSGTVLIECQSAGIGSIGVESHPFVARVARAKLLRNESAAGIEEAAQAILSRARRSVRANLDYPPLIHKCFPPESLARLDAIRRAINDRPTSAPGTELAWLALASILRRCSPVGTANWQYVLPNKSKAKVAEPFLAFTEKVSEMTTDMRRSVPRSAGCEARIFAGDARSLDDVPDGWAKLVITSPPYPNNFDYADATRLEMSFFKEISSWGDLQESVRKYLLRSCTQHVSSIVGETESILAEPRLGPIRDEISRACRSLLAERESHGGKKNYHTMIAAYFSDLARVFSALRRAVAKGGTMVFVVGDSAPYGVHVPVERWLGTLALAAGFESFRFEKTRDRNIKWKNRKHRVPLHEGRLWIEG